MSSLTVARNHVLSWVRALSLRFGEAKKRPQEIVWEIMRKLSAFRSPALWADARRLDQNSRITIGGTAVFDSTACDGGRGTSCPLRKALIMLFRDEISERRLVGVNVTERKEQLCARRAVLREQNALPYEAWIMKNLTAKDDVDNVGAGRVTR